MTKLLSKSRLKTLRYDMIIKVDGVDYWTDGHILLNNDYVGREQNPEAKVDTDTAWDNYRTACTAFLNPYKELVDITETVLKVGDNLVVYASKDKTQLYFVGLVYSESVKEFSLRLYARKDAKSVEMLYIMAGDIIVGTLMPVRLGIETQNELEELGILK